MRVVQLAERTSDVLQARVAGTKCMQRLAAFMPAQLAMCTSAALQTVLLSAAGAVLAEGTRYQHLRRSCQGGLTRCFLRRLALSSQRGPTTSTTVVAAWEHCSRRLVLSSQRGPAASATVFSAARCCFTRRLALSSHRGPTTSSTVVAAWHEFGTSARSSALLNQLTLSVTAAVLVGLLDGGWPNPPRLRNRPPARCRDAGLRHLHRYQHNVSSNLIAISTFGISIASSNTFGDFIGITKAANKPPVVASPRSWQARG